MRSKWFPLTVMMLFALLLGCATAPPSAEVVPRMTPADLRANLDNPKLVVLDVRTTGEWRRSPTKIKGALRVDPKSLDWAGAYAKDSLVVLYCT